VSTLEVRGLVKHYTGAEIVRAVDGVSLIVPAGELVAVFGPSGSGKSTLLQLAAGLLRPDRGAVIFDDRDITQMSSGEAALYRRRDVGLVLQSFHLLGGATALENVCMKLLASGYSLQEAKERAWPWLTRVGLASRAYHPCVRLSMGECQRVAIARALIGDPRLLLADEPTGSLDSTRSHETFGLLRSTCSDLGIPGVLVTHDREACSYASRVYELLDGKLVHDPASNPPDPAT
jgi:putative ABC transport system ATP-binding protein